jgi:hypothetical protein
LSKEALGFRDLEVTVHALSRDRKKTVIRLKRRHGEESSSYEGTADSLPEAGVYTLTAILKGTSKKGQEVEAESEPLRFELSGVVKKVEPTATPTPREVHNEEPKQAEKLPLLPIVLISGSSVLAMIVGIFLTKNKKGSTAVGARYNPPKQMLDAIASLEQKIAASDLKVGDVKLESQVEAERAEATAKAASAADAQGGQQEADATPAIPPPSEEE